MVLLSFFITTFYDNRKKGADANNLLKIIKLFASALLFNLLKISKSWGAQSAQ